jgi:hypothetical protein
MGGITISHFIILGIFLLISSSFFLYIVADDIQNPEINNFDTLNIRNYIQECLNIASEKAIWSVGVSVESSEYLNLNEAVIPVYEKESDLTEYFLKRELIISFDDCYHKEYLEKMGINISSKNRRFEIKIYNQSVYVRLYYPIIITGLSATQTFDIFEVTKRVRLGEFMHFVEYVHSSTQGVDIGQECAKFDDSTNVYIFPYNSTHKFIKLIDYSTFNNPKSFIMQRGLARTDIKGYCSG